MMYDPSFLLLFVPGVWLAWAIAGRVHPAGRGAVLLAASILFCGQLGVPVLAFCSLFALLNLAGARLLAKRPSAWLAGTLIASNIAVLAVFKYASFLADSVAAAVGAHAPALHILAPAGLSFLFFRAVSALIEIRRGSLAGFGNLDYLLYLLYFPTYLAGPIATFGEVEPQLEGGSRGAAWSDAAAGLALVGLGLFKKMALADHLAPFCHGAFAAASSGGQVHFVEAWGATLAYGFEIYFDFSGYSDMAIGLSRLFGIRLPANFDSPYKAVSVRDFWRRWHITLSRFFRDNLYIPLGGNRRGAARTMANVLVVMGLCGLWHGAGWTFVLWGLMHGAYLAVNNLWRALPAWCDPGRLFPRAWKAFCGASTFLAVFLAWVPFRAESLAGAWVMWKAMLTPVTNLFLPLGAPGTLPVPYEYLPGWRVFVLPEGILPNFGGWTQLEWLAACFLIVWALPSSQRWLAELEPVLAPVRAGGKALRRAEPENDADRNSWPVGETDGVPGGSGRPPRAWKALAAGGLFAAGLALAWFTVTPSAFLYARF